MARLISSYTAERAESLQLQHKRVETTAMNEAASSGIQTWRDLDSDSETVPLSISRMQDRQKYKALFMPLFSPKSLAIFSRAPKALLLNRAHYSPAKNLNLCILSLMRAAYYALLATRIQRRSPSLNFAHLNTAWHSNFFRIFLTFCCRLSPSFR